MNCNSFGGFLWILHFIDSGSILNAHALYWIIKIVIHIGKYLMEDVYFMDANNKVFLLKKVCSTLMDGTYTDIIAIFSTHEKATEVIMYQHDIRRYEKLNDN